MYSEFEFQIDVNMIGDNKRLEFDMDPNKLLELKETKPLIGNNSESIEKNILLIKELMEQFEDRLSKMEVTIINTIHRIEKSEENILLSAKRAIEAEKNAKKASDDANNALNQYMLTINSESWKFKYPLRVIGKFIRWLYYGSKAWITFSPYSRPRRILRYFISLAEKYIKTNPKLKFLVLKVFRIFPNFKKSILKIQFETYKEVNNYDKIKLNDIDLSPNEKLIYLDIKQAMFNNKGNKDANRN